MSNKYTFEEVMELADTKPNTQIWCISTDGTVDCLITALGIKKAVFSKDNTGIDWHNVNFMKVGNAEDDQQEQQNDNESTSDEFTITRKKIKHKVQMFRANNLADLMVIVNQFLEDREDVIKVDYQIGQSNTIGLLSMEYSVMIHYIESQV